MAQELALLGGRPIRRRPFTSWPVFGKAEETRLLRTLRSGRWGRLHGDEVATFERRFAAMHGCRHGIPVVDGTASLRLALMAAGLRAEDEVIAPPYTFFSTASAVIEATMIPTFADIDIVRAFEELHEGRDALADWSRRAGSKSPGAKR